MHVSMHVGHSGVPQTRPLNPPAARSQLTSAPPPWQRQNPKGKGNRGPNGRRDSDLFSEDEDEHGGPGHGGKGQAPWQIQFKIGERNSGARGQSRGGRPPRTPAVGARGHLSTASRWMSRGSHASLSAVELKEQLSRIGYTVKSKEDQVRVLEKECRAMNTRMEDFSSWERRHATLEEEMSALRKKENRAELQRKILQHIRDRTSNDLTGMKSSLAAAREELRAVDKHLGEVELVYNHAGRTAREAVKMAKFSLDEATKVARQTEELMMKREVRGRGGREDR